VHLVSGRRSAISSWLPRLEAWTESPSEIRALGAGVAKCTVEMRFQRLGRCAVEGHGLAPGSRGPCCHWDRQRFARAHASRVSRMR
jgi:hypothetical protein